MLVFIFLINFHNKAMKVINTTMKYINMVKLEILKESFVHESNINM